MKKVRWKTLRGLVCGAVFVLVIVGLLFHTGTGTLSSLGIASIAAVCPLGQLETMLTGQNVNAHAFVMLAVMVVLVVLLGKAFCAWLCPSPHMQKFFRGKKKGEGKRAREKHGDSATVSEDGSKAADIDARSDCTEADASVSTAADAADVGAATADRFRPDGESAAVSGAKADAAAADDAASAGHHVGCAACRQALGAVGGARDGLQIDSRHVVLLGALLSAAVFGFPVFCFICPIGLSFATVIAVWHLFGFSEVTIGVLLFPAIILVELVLCKRWCLSFCPMGALVSLISRLNVFARPRVDASRCMRSKGVDCRVCVETCPEQVDPHSLHIPECSKCGECVGACPASAIDFKLLPTKNEPADSTSMQKE